MHLDLMRDKAKALPAIAAPDTVRSLRIWHCSYKTLEPLNALKNLRTLVIATFPGQTLGLLAALRELRYLRILHLPRVRDLSPLTSLSNLNCLSLETLPSWDPSNRTTEVDSLDPIGILHELRHLSLFGVHPKDKSLIPIQRCPALKSAQFSKYPQDEVERFYRATGVSNASVPEPEFDGITIKPGQ